jgi:predicted nucleic acid-binding protein
MRIDHIRNQLLSEVSLDTYTNDRLREKWVEVLTQERAFHLFVPKQFGGLQLRMSQGIIALIEVAKIHGSLGWALNLGAGANYFSGCFEADVALELFKNNTTILAGSGGKNGTAREINQKYIINGSWDKCTGAAHASHFTFNAVHKDGRVSSFLIPASEVKTVDNWPIFGLKATSSFGITIENQIVREKHRFIIGEIKNNVDYSVFQLDFEVFARLSMSASFIGIVAGFIQHYEQHLLNRNFKASTCVKNTKKVLNETENSLKECTHLYDELIELSPAEKVLAENMLLHQLPEKHVDLFMCVQQIYLEAGMAITQESQVLHWAYRDVMTAIQHYMLKRPASL